MFSKSTMISNLLLAALLATVPVCAKMRWLERDGRAIYPRRFGQEHPAVIDKLSAACEGQTCGVLAGSAISTLLAAAGECTQQDMADQIIDAAAKFDAATQANMIALAIEFRQVEKNTPPDFTTNPPTNRNSVFCQKAPKNSQLNGLVQAQDPANDPNLFFDPATKASVKKGAQANTFPFGASGSSGASSGSDSGKAASSVASATAIADAASTCPPAKTVTVTASATAAAASTPCPEPKTFTVTASAAASANTGAASSSSSGSSAAASSGNLQKFTGALGGVTPPAVTSLGGGNFQVDGNAQFNNEQNALVRSCDVQHNQCANKANATGNKGDLTVDACGKQQDSCNALARST